MSFTLTFDEDMTNGSVHVRLSGMTEETFWRIAKQNEGVKIEMTADGELVFYFPSGGGCGISNAGLTAELGM